MSTIEDLVGEGKQYASQEDLARGKIYADEHIKKIEIENAALRDKVKDAEVQGDLFTRLKDELSEKKEVPVVDPNKPVVTQPPVDEKPEVDFDKRVAEVVAEINDERQTKENLSRSLELMAKHFGERSKEVYTEKAQTLGVSKAFLEDVASRSPDAFASLMGIGVDNNNKVPTVTHNRENIPANISQNQNETLSSSLEERKKIGNDRYFTPERQKALFQKALADPGNFLK